MPDFWGQIPGGYQTPGQGAIGPIGTPRPDSDYWSNYFNQQFQNGIAAPQYDTTNQDQARLQQQQVIQDLQAAARGNPNSLAQQELRKQNELARSQQSSLGSTMRGQSAGAAQRGIAAGQAGVARELPGQSQMLQLQEQQAAQAMLAQLLQQQRQQDIAQAQGMAQNSLSGQSALDNYYRQLFGGALDVGAQTQQNALGQGLAQSGFDLASQQQQQGFYRDLINGAATATATAGQAWGQNNQGGSGFRQVGGQDSIVPLYDK